MAIAPLPSNQRDIRQIGERLRDLRRSALDIASGAVLEISRAIPLYRPPQGRFYVDLTQVRQVALRYLIFTEGAAEAGLTADVEPEGSRPGTVTIATAPSNLIPCLRLAESAAQSTDFELRAIEVPAADAAALWLYGERNEFIDLMSAETPQSLSDASYLESINALLAAREARRRAGSE